MITDKHLAFLSSKMQELGNALFYNFSTSVLKLPVSIISLLKVDEVGNILFAIKKPKQSLANFDKDFPAQLHFYRKGCKYHIKVHGKAVVIDEPEEINSLEEDIKYRIGREQVLVKVKILKAEYFDSEETEKAGLLTTFRNLVNKWIFREEPGYHPYFYNTDTAF